MKNSLLIILSLLSSTALAQTVTLTANPDRGTSSVSTTLTWTATDVDVCTASGGWTGTKPLTGSQTIVVNSTTTFVLTCVKNTGTAKVSWRAPTERTDGSPLTNLKEYLIYRATTSTGVANATPVIVAVPITEYTFTNLAAGTWYFGARARDANGLTSVMSNIADKTITTMSVLSQVTVTVDFPPKPPSLVTVETVVYEIRKHQVHGLQIWRQVGTISLGIECNPNFNINEYYEVPLSEVQNLRRLPNIPIVVARCS
jgi:hypothetical protein